MATTKKFNVDGNEIGFTVENAIALSEADFIKAHGGCADPKDNAWPFLSDADRTAKLKEVYATIKATANTPAPITPKAAITDPPKLN